GRSRPDTDRKARRMRACRRRAPRIRARGRSGRPRSGRSGVTVRRARVSYGPHLGYLGQVAAGRPKPAIATKLTALDDATLHRRVEEFGRTRRERDMGDRLAAEEEEVAQPRLLHQPAEHRLLVGVPRQPHAVQTVHLLYESRAVHPFEGRPTPQIGHPEERLSRREKVFACRVAVREIDEGRDMLARDEASALSAIANEPYFQPAALVRRRGRPQATRRRGKTRFGDEGAAGKLRQDRRRGGRPLTDGRRCDDDHSVAPVLGELVQVGARTPSEVKVLALYISPLVARSKDSDVFAPVRLIDELAIGSRLRVQVERTSSHHRAVRPDDRNTDGRYVGRCHLSTGRRAAPTSSRCRSGVFFGASRTAAGSRATWSAIRTSAAANASSVSFGSVSVGSTMSASGTISGK